MNIFKKVKIIDLTHTLNPSIPSWEGSCGFKEFIKLDYDKGFKAQEFTMLAGIGTHIDAPAHFIPGGKTINELKLNNLLVQVSVIDVSKKSHPNYQISIQDINDFETCYDKIKPHSFIIFYTGWSKFWKKSAQYRNTNNQNIMEFPTVSMEAAKYLLTKDITGIGIDTLSPDKENSDFPVHKIILGAEKYIVENLSNCDKLPAVGASIIICPLNIKNGTESPIRALALI